MTLRPRKPYDHARFAGGPEDVFKHAVLMGVLDGLLRARPEAAVFRYFESHAGAGRYDVRGQARWRRGAGRLEGEAADGPPRPYEGSWWRVAQRLAARTGPARLVLCEQALEVHAEASALAASLPAHVACELRLANGFEAARDTLATAAADLLLIDPTFIERDWERLEPLVAQAMRVEAPCLVWYPVFGEARPEALLRAAGGGAALELVTGRGRRGRDVLMKGGGLWLNPPGATLAKPLLPSLTRLAAQLEGQLITRGGL